MPKIPMGYRQIADDLRARILAGEYQPGQQLPTYDELVKLYSSSGTTLQRSIFILKTEGFVVTVPGEGLYVAEKLP